MQSRSNRSPGAPSCASRWTSAALLAFCAASGAQAFQPLITDDTGTQGSGGNQLELSGTRNKSGETTGHDLTLVYTRGLTDTLDIFVETGRQRIQAGNTVTGPVNTAMGVKWRFYENDSKTSLALKPRYIAPLSTGHENAGLGTGKSSYELSCIATQETSWGAIHANLLAGRARYRDTSAHPDEKIWQLSLAPVWNLASDWKLAADFGISRTRAGGATERSHFVEMGAVYAPTEAIDLALGFIRTRNQDTDTVTHTATAGITWRF